MIGRHLLISLLSIIVLLAFVGCGDDDDSSLNPNNDELEFVGTWTNDSVTVNDTLQSLSNFFEWDQNTVMAQTTINTDSTQKYEELNAQDSVIFYDEGIVTVTGQTVIVHITSVNGQSVTPYVTFDGTWSMSGSALLLTMVENTDTIRLYLTKQ